MADDILSLIYPSCIADYKYGVTHGNTLVASLSRMAVNQRSSALRSNSAALGLLMSKLANAIVRI